MFKKSKIKISILLISLFFIIFYFLINLIEETNFSNKLSLSYKNKQLIKKYIFPYRVITQQEQLIADKDRALKFQNQFLENVNIYEFELIEKSRGDEIGTNKSIIKLSKNLILKRYQLNSGFYAGTWLVFPGSGYIDFNEGNIVILSSRGVLAFKKDLNNSEENFKQIKNNINEFIGPDQFKKNRWFSLKDLLISKNKIFISFTEEIKESCWNTSIIYGDMNYENIVFKKLFSSKECVHSLNNIDKEFNAHQSGGRIVSLDNNHILLSIGDYRNRYLAQDKQSINGKILKVNLNNSDYEIISMGHRNPQGLYLDKENNFLIETEHGPQGGDEINLIDLREINKDEIRNFGWPISSYGEHYKGSVPKSSKEKYPLYKTHIDHGFIEPLRSFVPSIGISEIVRIGQNKYVASSLRAKSLYFFELDKNKKINNIKRVKIMERARDLRLYNNQLYLFMENTASIGVINLQPL